MRKIDGDRRKDPHVDAVDDMLEVIPASLVASSEGRAWDGFEVVRFRHGEREVAVPPLQKHLVVVYLGPTLDMHQKLDGDVNEELVVKGSATVVPAGLPSEWYWKEPVEESDNLHVYLEPGFVRKVAAEVGIDAHGAEIIDALGIRDPQAERIGVSLLSELETGGLGGELYAESLANALTVHLLRDYSSLGGRANCEAAREPKGGLSKLALDRATDYVDDNLAKELTVREIAGAASMSPYHFSRLFKRSTGLPPHRYVIRRRVQKARELLTTTDLSVGAVALAVGFANHAHLTRHFKNLLGMSPGRFRTEARR